MVSVTDIPKLKERFLSRDEFEKIQARVERLPMGRYMVHEEKLICVLTDKLGNPMGKYITIGKIDHPGSAETLISMREDMGKLINHVLNADEENDLLIEENKKLREALDEKETLHSG